MTGPAEVNDNTTATVGSPDADASAPGEQRAAAWPRVASPALQNLLALLIYIAVFVVGYGLPVLAHLGVPQVGQHSVDPNFYIWSWRWWPYALGHGLNPLHTTEVGAPGGYDLSWATTVPAASVALAPVTAAFGPIVSFNLTLLLSAPLSGWAVFLAARRLTGRFWAALLGGAVYGFSSFEVSHSFAGHFNLTVNILPPLMLYLVLLWRDGKLGRAAFTGLLAVAMALQFYLFLEAFTAMTLLWAAALVIGYAVAGPSGRHTVARLAGLAGIAYVLALVLASPYLLYALRHYPANFVRYSDKYLLNPVNLVVPRPDRLFFLTSLSHYAQSVRGFSSAAYVGIPLLLVLILLAVTNWSSRITRLLIILFAVFFLIAIGPRLMINNTVLFSLPWSALWSLPIMHSAEPVRFFVVDFLVLALVLTWWLARPMRTRLGLASQWLLGLLSVAFILGNLPIASDVIVQPVRAGHVLSHTNALPAFMTEGLYRRYLRPGETVVVVSDRGNAGMLFQADADFYLRIAGGFVNESLSTASGLPPAVVALRHGTPGAREQFRAYVRSAGVSAVLVEQAWSARWMKVFARMRLPAVRAGGVIIYDTTGGSG